MEKFTQYEKEENKKEVQTAFNNKDYKIISYDNHQIMESTDKVVILPYFRDEGFILLQYETNLNYHFKLKDKGEYKNVRDFLSVIKSPVEEGQSAISEARKSLLENGVVLNAMFPIEIERILFKDENQTGQYYISILQLYQNDYKFIKGSGTSKIVKIDLGNIDNIRTMDIITDYMLLKLKGMLKI